MKVYRCIFDDRSKIEAIAFVKQPAILKNFNFKTNAIIDTQLGFIFENNIVTSPLLVPEQMIYRVDGNGEEYYIYYTYQDVVSISNYIVRNANNIKFNIEHDSNRIIEGVEFIGVATTSETTVDMTLIDLPVGSLLVQLMVNNDSLKDMIKRKEVEGLSIEGVITMIEDENAYINMLIEQDRTLKKLNDKLTKKRK